MLYIEYILKTQEINIITYILITLRLLLNNQSI